MTIQSNPCEQRSSSAERRRKFGQVFTPPQIAALMADWVLEKQPKTVMDPAFGAGALASACLQRSRTIRFFGYEIDPVVLEEVPPAVAKLAIVELTDFLSVPSSKTFDAIIANPPYIRHRELNDHFSARRNLERTAHCEIPKSANLYVDFLVKATLHLKPGGRAAFLIPAEWMSANFSVGLKHYLLERGLLDSLITFSNCSNVFPDALTTASIVLLEKRDPRPTIVSYYLRLSDGTAIPPLMTSLASDYPARSVDTSVLRKASKWEPILRGDATASPPGWVTLGEIATTRRGIATGANEFFLISDATRLAANISEKHILPCIGRSNDVRGLDFSAEDFARLRADGAKIWLLNFSSKLSSAERTYVERGEEQQFHKRHLTMGRTPWFSMEQRDPAPIWAGVFGRGDLRFIYNRMGARSLTNFHCIYPRSGGTDFAQALVAVLNSDPVKALMVSHQRGYGGGLIKFEPKDLLTVPIPNLLTAPSHLIAELAAQLPVMSARESNGLGPATDRLNDLVSSFSGDDFKLY